MKHLLLFLMLITTPAVCLARGNTSNATLSDVDQLLVAVQGICPVTGLELGSEGTPFKVKVGGQVVFLCNAKYRSEKIKAEHWTRIQERIAEAQSICPIMGKPVDSTMESTTVRGHKIFVCCPPCIEKISAEPTKSIDQVTKSYAAFVKAELLAKSDQLHIKAQGICPVSGHELGSMGKPVKVKVGQDEHAFLCCQECVGKKLSSQHWKTIQSNLAKAQAVCPIMGQPVDSTMESVVVKGRRIFVCCPPCIAKIEAEPEGNIARVNQRIAASSLSSASRVIR